MGAHADIPRSAVSSSNVKSIGYDPEQKVMTVEFHNKSLYAYHDVPPETHEGLLKAKSIGGHLNKLIRAAHRSTKLSK